MSESYEAEHKAGAHSTPEARIRAVLPDRSGGIRKFPPPGNAAKARDTECGGYADNSYTDETGGRTSRRYAACNDMAAATANTPAAAISKGTRQTENAG